MYDTGWLTPTSTGNPSNTWINPSNAFAEDGNYTTAKTTRQDYADFGISVPSGKIVKGIEVRTKGAGSVSPAGKCGIELSWHAGAINFLTGKETYTTTGKFNLHYGGIGNFDTAGSASDLWGRSSWSSIQLNNTFFRVGLSLKGGALGIDVVEVRVHYADATYTSSATGTVLFSGDANRQWVTNRSATGTLNFSGTALAIKTINPSIIEKKTFMYKVYDFDDNFLGVLDDVVSELNFSEELNSAGSTINVTLARNSDSLVVSTSLLLDSDSEIIQDSNDLAIMTTTESRNKVGPGSNVNHNYRVDIYVFYGEVSPILDSDGLPILDNEGGTIDGTIGSPNGIRRFTGFVSEINSKYGDTENTEVQLMSYGYDLDQYIVQTSEGDTTVPFNSYDPSNIVKEGLDQFIIDGEGTFTSYTPATVQTTGTVVSYTFRANTYLELLKKSIELSPVDWFFYVDLGTNFVNFNVKSEQPYHIFYLGKHIKDLNLRTYIGDVVNDVLFTGGEVSGSNLFKRYTRTPLAGTRRGLSRLNDNRVTLDDSAEILSEGELDAKQSIQYRSTVTILDKTYDIESIRVGQTIGFRNFGNYVDTIVMQVVALNYTPEAITLQLDTLPDSTNKRLEDLKRNLNLQENENVPDSPT